MQRYFIQLSYDGTAYHGWQVQLNAHTVQEELEKALSTITREEIELVGAGRTDTGVHASFYIAHFDSKNETLDQEQIAFKVNCLLPFDIAVQRIYKVGAEAHARFDATYREYKYYIVRHKDPFIRYFAEKETRLLDLKKMNEAAATLFEYQDFTSFSRMGSDVKTNNCVIYNAEWIDEGDRLVFTISADRFLRNMVRAIVGTLLDVGLGKTSVEGFRKIIEKQDRGAAGASVAAKGLFLVDIGYPLAVYRQE
jgi:tRNA pseudouridine38-40 synthase